MNPEMSYALFLLFAHSRVGVYVCVCACWRAALAKDVCHVANNSDTACPEQRMAQREVVLQGKRV